ncbi:MAG TPA: transcriptional regulator NrdR [Tepidiformaceae bacterium]|nr:transcriptional regulator NrdR [Tepidiformaceae bacterium]
MRCPYCQYRDSKVTDSRANDDGIRRRRECISCGERFTTVETVQLSTVQVVKKDGRREDFNREKLLAGLRKACSKRTISVKQLEQLVAEIEVRAAADGRAEVAASLIGEMAMDGLRRLDHIAYIRFASVYRAFTDIESLKEAVDALESGRIVTLEERTLQLPLPGEGEEVAPPSVTGGLIEEIEREHLRAAGGTR